jgi:hypothetical protein
MHAVNASTDCSFYSPVLKLTWSCSAVDLLMLHLCFGIEMDEKRAHVGSTPCVPPFDAFASDLKPLNASYVMDE